MKGDLKWKIPLVLIAIVTAAVYLYPLDKAIHLGLDLQGGMRLILEVQTEKVVENELVRTKDILTQELKKKQIKFQTISIESIDTLRIIAPTPEEATKIQDYMTEEFSNFEKKGMLPTDAATVLVGLPEALVNSWQENAIKQALMTIRNRVDEFGLTEPVIQRQGKNRIVVELAGEKDPQRAIDVIGKTAELRFQLVKEIASSKDELLKPYNGKIPDGYEMLVSAPEAKNANAGPRFYLLEKEAKVTGADLKDARISKDELNMPAVSFELDRNGAKRFGTLTEQNIGKLLAIVLDKSVQSAPVVKSRITDHGQITGNFSLEEATDLAIVLRAGALPAPVKILQNIIVGASLGEDSVQAGKQAIIIGSIVVFVFMLIYYKAAGVIADLALAINMLLIMGILAYFKATLTLPGLAGIALTIGMAVDSNILIYERIKEEVRVGKTFRSAVENGFRRALVTIVDANLTTLLAGVILFQFGTGPVKGFAVTLSVGILTTLFSALIISKMIFDLILLSGKVKRIIL